MNDADIKFLRLQIQMEIQAAVLHGLIAAVSLMSGGQQIRQILKSALRDNSCKMTFPSMDPALSDMYAGEYQDAVAHFLSLGEFD